MSVAVSLATLYRRDLGRLARQIEAFPTDESLWQTLPGVTNSAGNLTLHLEGNLRDFIGRQVGDVAYQRERPLEFSLKGIEKAELLRRIDGLTQLIPAVVEKLTPEQLEAQHPQAVMAPISTQEFLIHLYAHLSWHLGQIDYLRRILTGAGALA